MLKKIILFSGMAYANRSKEQTRNLVDLMMVRWMVDHRTKRAQQEDAEKTRTTIVPSTSSVVRTTAGEDDKIGSKRIDLV